jgi:hypothetical protein
MLTDVEQQPDWPGAACNITPSAFSATSCRRQYTTSRSDALSTNLARDPILVALDLQSTDRYDTLYDWWAAAK